MVKETTVKIKDKFQGEENSKKGKQRIKFRKNIMRLKLLKIKNMKNRKQMEEERKKEKKKVQFHRTAKVQHRGRGL